MWSRPGNATRDGLNISVRIGMHKCGSLKYTSSGKSSSLGDLLRPACFNATRTSHSVTKPLQIAASAFPRRRSRLNSCEIPEPRRQDSEQSDQGSAPERPRTSHNSTGACARLETWPNRYTKRETFVLLSHVRTRCISRLHMEFFLI